MSSYIAGKMLEKKATGMLAPLLDSDDESQSSSDSDDSSTSTVSVVKQTPMQKLKSLAVYLGVGLGVAASGMAMALAPAIPIFVMGAICMANAPYSIFKEREMAKIPSLRSMANNMREAANDLADGIDALSGEIDKLEPEADKAAAVEEKLRDIADKQQFNVDKLVALVKENGAIQAEMRENLQKMVVQDVIQIVMRSDRDRSGTICMSEAKQLALMIRLEMKQRNVVFEHVKFLKVVKENPSIGAIIDLVTRIMPQPKKRGEASDDRDTEDRDPNGEEDDLYDMFHLPEDPKLMVGGATPGQGRRQTAMPGSKAPANERRATSLL